MSAVPAVDWSSYTPIQSGTNTGSHTSGRETTGVNEGRMLFFRGLRTTTTMLVIDEIDKRASAIMDQLNEIKTLANLTDEEVAELLGTTRQTLYNWRAGKKISARREQRLEKTLEAIRFFSDGNPQSTRRLLMAAEKGQVRVYDLFAEGSIEAAKAIAAGEPLPASRIPEEYPLTTQMGLIEDRALTPKPKIDKRFSKRL